MPSSSARSPTPNSRIPCNLPLQSPVQFPIRQKDPLLSSKKRLKRLAYGQNYIPEEETIRNDYSRHYVHTHSRPQNQIQNTALQTRFAEYPKLRKLLELKHALVASHAHPPTYLEADLRPGLPNSLNLLDLHPARFDVILLDPPLKEYSDSYPHLASDPALAKSGGPPGQERPWWSWDELEALPVPQIAASPGFIFLWCGSGQGTGLELGRALLAKWGYRKCEDLVWVKTNHQRLSDQPSPPGSPIPSVFASTKEHCLMGIRGTVRRSTDGHFVHCNVDTDVIVSEPDPTDVLHKPEELYHLIENFCLGRRRLELFGSSRSLRPGWLTIGTQCAPPPSEPDASILPGQQPIPYSKPDYLAQFLDPAGRTQNLLPTHAEIDSLRPRSPPGRIAAAIPGSPLPRGLGLGYTGSAPMPIVGPDGTVLATSISGRNTLSHPSGGLGRGPGNSLLPGMRVSGFRDSSNPASPRPTRNFTPPVYQNYGQQYPLGMHSQQALAPNWAPYPVLFPHQAPQFHPVPPSIYYPQHQFNRQPQVQYPFLSQPPPQLPHHLPQQQQYQQIPYSVDPSHAWTFGPHPPHPPHSHPPHFFPPHHHLQPPQPPPPPPQ